VRQPFVARGLWAVSLVFVALWMASALVPANPSKEAGTYFSEEFLATARRRATLAYIDSGLSTLAALGVLYLATRLVSRGQLLSSLFRGELPLANAAALGLFLGAGAALLLGAVDLPFSICGLYLDKAFGLSKMTLPAYLLDYAKGTSLNVLAYSLGGGFTVLVLVKFPRTWHFVLAGAFLLASLLVSMVYPTVIAPMFNKFHPLPAGPVQTAVDEMAAKAGMHIDKVLVMEASAKTTRVNAYFAGIGRTKQVVLYDTLLTSNSIQEVRLVLAHEMGHWKLGHVGKGLLVSAAGTLALLWVFRVSLWPPGVAAVSSGEGLGRLLVSLLVFITLAGYVLTPASSFVSRVFESRADAYSLYLSGDSSAFISTQVGLAVGNLSDVDPPAFIRWFAWTHPTTMERIRSAMP